MKFLIAFVVALVAVSAQEYEEPHPQLLVVDNYPMWYLQPQEEPQERSRRDVTFDHPVGGGKVFGTLGSSDAGLFGKGGYNRNIFNDHRGKLDGTAYGSHVLGDSSRVGGALNWQNNNAAASLDYSKQIHGPSSFKATGGGRWPVGKNGDFSAQGFYEKTQRLPGGYGGQAEFNYRF